MQKTSLFEMLPLTKTFACARFGKQSHAQHLTPFVNSPAKKNINIIELNSFLTSLHHSLTHTRMLDKRVLEAVSCWYEITPSGQESNSAKGFIQTWACRNRDMSKLLGPCWRTRWCEPFCTTGYWLGPLRYQWCRWQKTMRERLSICDLGHLRTRTLGPLVH